MKRPKRTKAKKMKPVLAWAVVTKEGLTPWGCENLWRYPIFFTRKDANEFKRNQYIPTKIIRVRITEA